MKRLVLCLLVIAVSLGYAIVRADDDVESDFEQGSWSPVIYPQQRLPVTFSHQQHLARGATCAQCHPAAAGSRSAVDNLIPTETQCRACHAIDRASNAGCDKCHPKFQAGQAVGRIVTPAAELKFDHAAHGKTACTDCHDVGKVALATTRQLPDMASCLRCHTNGNEERRCADCHLTQLGGMMQTRFTHGDLVPHHDGLGDAHGPEFKNRHAQEARQVGATCTACHDQSECIACHQGVTKPMEFHAGNYLLTHAVEARRGTPDCTACHRTESFCVACHERAGIATRANSDFNSSGDPARAFHPIGFANRHAVEARKNITSCSSCHREEFCMKCHTAEPGNAVKANPHPPGWRGSAKCKAMDRGNRRMCLRCHVQRDELGCDWTK